MKKKLKLKGFVIPIMYIILVSVFVFSGLKTFVNSNDDDETEIEDIKYVSNIIWSDEIPVVSTDKFLIKPYLNENVKIVRNYYDYNANKENQQNSIIFYEGTYFQNSGIDYVFKDAFDVIAIYDGIVIKVEDNSIVGKTIEIKHDNNIISVYQGLSEISAKEGEKILQGSIIGKSGISSINSDLGNHLHFEMYINGQVVNPEDYYNKKINQLQ